MSLCPVIRAATRKRRLAPVCCITLGKHTESNGQGKKKEHELCKGEKVELKTHRAHRCSRVKSLNAPQLFVQTEQFLGKLTQALYLARKSFGSFADAHNKVYDSLGMLSY